MIDMTKYYELNAKVALCLGWTYAAGMWRSPNGFEYQALPKAYANDDAVCFDLMHKYGLWPFKDAESGNFMVEYKLPGDVNGYHLEYANEHHTAKIALRCAILNALVKHLNQEGI